MWPCIPVSSPGLSPELGLVASEQGHPTILPTEPVQIFWGQTMRGRVRAQALLGPAEQILGLHLGSQGSPQGSGLFSASLFKATPHAPMRRLLLRLLPAMLQASQALHQLLLLKLWPWGALAVFLQAQAIFAFPRPPAESLLPQHPVFGSCFKSLQLWARWGTCGP